MTKGGDFIKHATLRLLERYIVKWDLYYEYFRIAFPKWLAIKVFLKKAERGKKQAFSKLIFSPFKKMQTDKCLEKLWVLKEWCFAFSNLWVLSTQLSIKFKKVNAINILGNNGSTECRFYHFVHRCHWFFFLFFF